MIIEDIIESLEKYIHKKNSNVILVVQKEIEPCKFKVFKKIRYTLWLIDKFRDKRFPLICILCIKKIDSQETEENVIRTVEMLFIGTLFEYVRGKEFNLILEGNYEGNEQISDSIN